MIWIFMESEEDEIKSKQASKKDGTLSQNQDFQEFFFCDNQYKSFLKFKSFREMSDAANKLKLVSVSKE